MAKSDAAMAYDEALRAKNISESTRVDLEALLNNIRDFLQQDGATPADVEAVCFHDFFDFFQANVLLLPLHHLLDIDFSSNWDIKCPYAQ